ncbi:MAG TPA: class II fumarate hydratase [Chloroflexota bacterium]|nr:class II fumarate hydratase [Chloroflexota bacterium]
MTREPAVRLERDSMGEVEVPREAYYGAQTARAVENFPIGHDRMPPEFVHALGLLKQAAAEVNIELGQLDERRGRVIVEAAAEVASGRFDGEFPVGIYQTGSGTSTNMNANEVIAARANELLGGERGAKGEVHPNDHVNKGQSSNDMIPTTMHLSAMIALRDGLIPALHELETELRKKACELWPVIKTGRTHLQDATPIRLGQEFLGYADQIRLACAGLRTQIELLGDVALGGTAVGTGLNAHPDFARLVLERLHERLSLPLRETPYHFMAQSTVDPLVLTSGVLKALAVSLLKIANDIRWMGSGPRAGIGELKLPDLQPGSSIMPGKVNPVMAESLAMVAAQVIGHDAAVTVAGQSGNFELNVMLPLVSFDILDSIDILAAAARCFARRTVAGLEATRRGPEMVEQGLMLVTALAPVIGYDRAAELAKEASASGRTVRDLARERTDLSDEEISRLLDPEKMVGQSSATQH